MPTPAAATARALLLLWCAASVQVAEAAPAAAPVACGTVGAGSDCFTPPPKTAFQTILMWDCTGRVRFLPDNPMFNVNLDVPMLPRLFEKLYESIGTYAKGHCQGTSLSPTKLRDRFHPLSFMFYGNRMYSTTDVDEVDCLDSAAAFTRDFTKLYKALAGKTTFEMPSSCKWDMWTKDPDPYRKKYPKCSFIHDLMEIGASIQVVVQKCESHRNFFRVSIGCAGPGCELFKPCSVDEDCHAPDHMVCANPFQWVDPKVKNALPKFNESDVYNLMRDYLRFYGDEPFDAAGKCKAHNPSVLFKKFLSTYEALIVGSPAYRKLGATCSVGSAACKVCMPAHTSAFETTLSSFPGRWREVSDDFPKDRRKYDSDGCVLAPHRIVANDSVLMGRTLPTILSPLQPTRGSLLLFESRRAFFETESPLAQGTRLFLRGQTYQIGGAACTSDINCGAAGICMNDDEDFCEMAQDECGRHAGICEYTPMGVCVPVHAPKQPPVQRCACFALDRFSAAAGGEEADAALFTYGASCSARMFIAPVDQEDLLDTLHTQSVHKWRSRYDAFVHWDGETAADGLDPFKERDHWAKFPAMTAPSGEKHLVSTQCDGVVHFFMKTPYHMRLFAPKASEMLQLYGDWELGSWSCRDKRNVVFPDSYMVSQAAWRPEFWMYAKLRDADHGSTEAPMDFDTLFQKLFDGTGGATPADADYHTFWNFKHLWRLSDSFNLQSWIEKKDKGIGVRYTGLACDGANPPTPKRACLMSKDFAVNVRMKECPSHPMGFVNLHVSCEGRSCEELFYSTTCAGPPDCGYGAVCQPAFQSVYDEDTVSQWLWGVNRPVQPAPTGGDAPFTASSLCPALETPGKRGSTSRERVGAVRQLAQRMWLGTRYPDCKRRSIDRCWQGCEWRTDADGQQGCQYEKGKEPPAFTGAKVQTFCAPVLHPLMGDTFEEAAVLKQGFKTPVCRRGIDAQSFPLLPDSACIYDVYPDYVRDERNSSLVFSVAAYTSKPEEAKLETEEVDRVLKADKTTKLGMSFVVVMCVMGVIVVAGSLCVYLRYVMPSRGERERTAMLKGLTFECQHDQEDITGKDLMLPAMYRRWLPLKKEKKGEDCPQPPRTLENYEESEEDMTLAMMSPSFRGHPVIDSDEEDAGYDDAGSMRGSDGGAGRTGGQEDDPLPVANQDSSDPLSESGRGAIQLVPTSPLSSAISPKEASFSPQSTYSRADEGGIVSPASSRPLSSSFARGAVSGRSARARKGVSAPPGTLASPDLFGDIQRIDSIYDGAPPKQQQHGSPRAGTSVGGGGTSLLAQLSRSSRRSRPRERDMGSSVMDDAASSVSSQQALSMSHRRPVVPAAAVRRSSARQVSLPVDSDVPEGPPPAGSRPAAGFVPGDRNHREGESSPSPLAASSSHHSPNPLREAADLIRSLGR